ncbi:hypothetical protein [Shewanella chilikensis]|uniref:DUF4145 domain-containing protein n=1 Tax=Shewanella chilikensis TaxID=558541 RepID=A0ABX5PRZ3_9GAMM|nr:hypothetical protein [Shewanella chilikensis]MCL1152768.1 hypothetical protein [Shewanella chilikensis]PYE60389.1 hypothetical protein C8J23_1031 [Shewanella chilikensis]GGZ18647.1 hypothetical protein GCM10007105_03070 [Shewanella chilikensis]
MEYSDFIKSVIEGYLEDQQQTEKERIERLVELNELFGPQGDKLLQGGTQSLLALHEVANSYVSGNFMAVILLCQAFIEHSLSGHFIMSGQNGIAESSFKKIIDSAKEQNYVSTELHNRLNELRLIRNPYVHAKAGLKAGSLDKKILDSGIFEPVEFAKQDSLKSLKILKEFMCLHVPMWFYEDET